MLTDINDDPYTFPQVLPAQLDRLLFLSPPLAASFSMVSSY